MNNTALIQRLILEILASDNIDEKRSKGAEVVTLFKTSKLVDFTPVAIRLNTTLELKEAIDNFITHDNSTTREGLKQMFSFISQLLCNDDKAA